jgi:hypothetical protein
MDQSSRGLFQNQRFSAFRLPLVDRLLQCIAVPGVTMSLSSGSGARSNTSASICGPIAASALPERTLRNRSLGIIMALSFKSE